LSPVDGYSSYEMAAYGTLVAWANVLGFPDAADLLEGILKEEKAADAALTKLAEGGINQQAAEAAGDEEDESSPLAPRRGTTSATADDRKH
jgi:hypothetical protein